MAGLSSARRIREALDETEPPPSSSLIETRADAGDRRSRVFVIVLFAVAALLVADRVVGGGGIIAGVVVGLFVTGLFSAVAVTSVHAASEWSTATNRAAAVSLVMTGIPLGGAVAAVVLPAISSPTSTSVAFAALAAISPLSIVAITAIYALETLVAFIQAYVFAILTCVYLKDALHPHH